MLSDRIELQRQLAEAQARAERAEATVAALRGTLRAIESETADSYDLFEQRVLQRVREALAAPDPGADQDGTASQATDVEPVTGRRAGVDRRKPPAAGRASPARGRTAGTSGIGSKGGSLSGTGAKYGRFGRASGPGPATAAVMTAPDRPPSGPSAAGPARSGRGRRRPPAGW